MNIQKALAKAGNSNRYQLYTAVFVCFKWLVCGFLILGPSYLFIAPTFTCGTRTKLSEAEACPIIDTCTIEYPYTLTAKRNLYCDNRYLRDSILSSQYIGSIVGLVLLSILADKMGRKVIIVITLFACAIGPIILAFGGHYGVVPLLFVGTIIMGFGAYSVSTVSFTYLAQVNSDKWRQILTVLTSSFWALSQIMFYPVIRFYPQWEVFVGGLMIGPSIILILMTYFIVETPTFLHSGNKSQCLYSLNYIATFNGKQRLTIDQLEDYQPEKTEQYQVQDTLLKWKFLLPVIILSIGQICNNGMYYITQFSINYIGDTFEMNMLLIGCLELVAYIITNLFCQKMRRKLWLIVFMSLSGAIGILFQFVFKNETSGWNPERIVETVFIAVTFGFALFNLITTQSFPSSIKTTGTGIVEAFSNLGNIVSPFIVTISDHIGIQSICVGGIVCLAGAVVMLLSKQTLVKTKEKTEEQPLLTQSTLEANNQHQEVRIQN